MKRQKIQISVPANLRYSSMIRHLADEVFITAAFSKAWSARLKLVVDELFMNAVRYGSVEDKSTVFITFEYDEAGVKFIIEDDGTGSQAISAEELQKKIQINEESTDLTRTSGRGLAMITKLWTDGMEITKSEHGGISLSFTKHIEAATTPPPPAPPPPELVALAKAKADLAASAPAQVPADKQPVQSTPQPVAEAVKPAAPAPTQPVVAGQIQEVKLSGEIDQSNIDAKVAPIYDQIEVMPEGSTLLLDFSELTYINSAFIGNLAAWHTHMQHKGGKILIKNMNDEIREILNLVGLLNVIEND